MKRDFDKFIKERKGTRTHSFIMFGVEYTLPPTIPYAAVLEFTALQKRDATEEISNDKLLELLAALIGKNNVTELIKFVEFDMEVAIELMNYVLEIYNLKSRKDESGNAVAVADQVVSA